MDPSVSSRSSPLGCSARPWVSDCWFRGRARGMSTAGSKRAIIAALLANAGIAVAKFVGFLITGSSSMLAEAVHSVADTSNQGLLLWGQRQASKAPDALHQFGHGGSRYFYSFVAALLLFTLGSVFALYEGIHKLSS